MKRRPQGSGSLIEKRPGRWEFRYTTGIDPLTGKQRRRTVTFEAKGFKEAQAKSSAIALDAEDTVTGSSASVAELMRQWMGFQATRGRSPTTLHGYQAVIDQRIVPQLGAIKLEALTPHDLDTFYASLKRADGQGPLSPLSVRNIHRVLSAALNQAVRWGWLDRNPADRATLPSAKQKTIVAPSPADAQRLIEACNERDPELGAFVFLASITGCRRGEIAALQWSDLEGSSLVISRSVYAVGTETGIKDTKSGRSRRVHLHPDVVKWLEQWRARCEDVAQQHDVELVSDGYIVSPWPDGSRPINIKSIGAKVRKVADRLDMPEIHLHSLRHFAATELLAAGISANDAAQMLGHSDPSLTMRVYAHATNERQRAAAAAMASVVKPPT